MTYEKKYAGNKIMKCISNKIINGVRIIKQRNVRIHDKIMECKDNKIINKIKKCTDRKILKCMDNKRMNYFVMVTSDIIKITNHKFYYTNQINLKFSDILVEKIKLAISRDRKKVEEEMFKNELNLLTDIDSNMDTNRPRHEEIIEPEKTASNKISDVMEAIFSI